MTRCLSRRAIATAYLIDRCFWTTFHRLVLLGDDRFARRCVGGDENRLVVLQAADRLALEWIEIESILLRRWTGRCFERHVVEIRRQNDLVQTRFDRFDGVNFHSGNIVEETATTWTRNEHAFVQLTSLASVRRAFRFASVWRSNPSDRPSSARRPATFVSVRVRCLSSPVNRRLPSVLPDRRRRKVRRHSSKE